MPDILLTCPECKEEFNFSEEEQIACTEQAFPPPTYCPTCHSQRKSARDEANDAKRRKGSRRRR